MKANTLYELLKENIGIQDEPLKKLIWTLDKNFQSDYNYKQNILLVGERGSGKTTMLKETANLMEIPMGEVYNMFVPNGFNLDLLLNGIAQIMNESRTGEGILLLHDFQDSFIYDRTSTFNSMLAAGTLDLGEGSYCNVSNITFVGEIDINNMRDIFPQERDLLAELENNNFVSPTLNVVKEYLTDVNIVTVDEEKNISVDLQFEKYIANQISNRFFSSVCAQAFGKKIFMEDMRSQELIKALKSPLSVLNLYKEDLIDEYINSESFVKKVVYQIMESGKGLHYTSEAIERVALFDHKNNQKVFKKGSLLGMHSK